jgi:ABC-type glycerol-3-phosphate transport system permease component
MLAPPEWIGFDNYRRIYSDPIFYVSLANTAYISFLAVPISLALALLIAMALNEKLKGIAIYCTIFYLLSQMPIVASALLWLWVFNPDFGLAFIHHWNDFLRPLVFLQDKDLRTLAIGLRLFRGELLVQWNLLMAASTLMLLPILALFFAAQRYFVQGIVMSGLKG